MGGPLSDFRDLVKPTIGVGADLTVEAAQTLRGPIT